MSTTLSLFVGLSLFALPAAPPAAPRLEVGFVADDADGPVAIFEASARDDGGTLERGASWVFFAGGESRSSSFADRVPMAPGAPALADGPSPPAGVGLVAEADGGLLVTLTDLGDWQAVAGVSPLGSRRHPRGPAVAGDDAARLLVFPPDDDDDGEGASLRKALLYGSRGVVEGRAWVDRRAHGDAGAALVWQSEDGLVGAGLSELLAPAAGALGAGAVIVDASRACKREVPSALVLGAEETRRPLRLSATATGTCLASGAVVLPLAGARLERREDAPIRGVLVMRPES
jgi:hypothetical protein